MKTFPFPAHPRLSQISYIKVPSFPLSALPALGRSGRLVLGIVAGSSKMPEEWWRCVGLFDSMEIDRMTDAGMYWWATILTIIGLVASYGIAMWWQRWRDEKKKLASPAPRTDES